MPSLYNNIFIVIRTIALKADYCCRAFLRILCVCCPRSIRRRYQPAFRTKASQVSGACSAANPQPQVETITLTVRTQA